MNSGSSGVIATHHANTRKRSTTKSYTAKTTYSDFPAMKTKTTPEQKAKVRKVMTEFKDGELNIGKSKKKVKSRRQAVAIALSEAKITRKDTKYLEGMMLSGMVPPDTPCAYTQAVLSVFHGDAKKKIKVKDPRVKGGFYYREQEVSDKPQASAPKRALPAKSSGVLKAVGLVAAGAIAGGAVAAFATKWQSDKAVKDEVGRVKAEAEGRVKQEVAKVQSESEVRLNEAIAVTKEEFELKKQAEIKKAVAEVDASKKAELEKLAAEHEQRMKEAIETTRSQAKAASEDVMRYRQAENDVRLREAVAKAKQETQVQIQKEAQQEIERRSAETERKVRAEIESRVQAEIGRRGQELESEMQRRSRQSQEDLTKQQAELSGQKAALTAKQSQLESEYQKRVSDLETQMAKDLELRTQQIEQRINTEAMQRITREREMAMRDAQDEIQRATQPKARRAGDLVDDDKEGIALGASTRQGLDLNDVSTANMERRVGDAVKRMVGRRQNQGMTDLAVSFRDRTRQIMSMGSDKPASNQKQQQQRLQRRWEAMESALLTQGRREAALSEESDRIRKETTSRYKEMLRDLQSEASGRGGYEQDLIDRFDKKSKRVNQEMQREIDRIVADINKNFPWEQDG